MGAIGKDKEYASPIGSPNSIIGARPTRLPFHVCSACARSRANSRSSGTLMLQYVRLVLIVQRLV